MEQQRASQGLEGYRPSHIAGDVAELASGLLAPPSRERGDARSLVDVARNLYVQRRERASMFEAGFFGEPAWDILLDLYVETQSGRQVDITSATIASCVPATTALRWLSVMEIKGIILRKPCETDRRRTFIQFSEAGLASMQSYLVQVLAN